MNKFLSINFALKLNFEKMKGILGLLTGLVISGFTFAQQPSANVPLDTSWETLYRGSAPRINDLVHTKLDVRFDIPRSIMYGKAWITLQPHFYPTDSLTLDAKYMDVREISIVKGNAKTKLKYKYDSLQLHIYLGRTFERGEKYTVFIDYIARPEDVKGHGSAAITDDKGLYFINPKGDGQYPTQIWTQGETESNSVWMPTIDKPDQKTTQEIAMTVPSKFVTLSNGEMTSQKTNSDGTRTDTWKMDLPNSPYLFFMGAGPFAIVKDKYKDLPVNYYVEKQYESVAKRIFGETPEMIGYFSSILNFPYPWPKYDQMVGRQYVSGAMENTTATLHQDGAYQNARQLVDGNGWESTIAHELFHHWFGDLVTTESWSNITLNESFADYAQYLWDEHRHGRDYADDKAFEEMQEYLMSNSSHKDLVRFYYRDKEDVFDAVSYNKGGRILNMLRNFVGDEAFFASLNRYLTLHKFRSAEAQELRLAFEYVTGLDMNWFWNQWYYGAGEPNLNISYNYEGGKQRIIIDQTQKGQIFTLPLFIDIYGSGNNKTRHKVWIRNVSDTFYFSAAQKPTLVNVDADKVLLAVKEDNKGLSEFEHQYKYAPLYLDRREALEYFAKNKPEDIVQVLADKYAGLRKMAIEFLMNSGLENDEGVTEKIVKIASGDPDKTTQAAGIEFLANQKNPKFKELFQRFINDSSYSVSGAALLGLANLEPENAYSLAKKYSVDAKGKLEMVISDILYQMGKAEDFDMLYTMYRDEPATDEKIIGTIKYAGYLAVLEDSVSVKMGVDEIVKFINTLPQQYRSYLDGAFKQMFTNIATQQIRLGNTGVAEYVRTLLP